MMRFFSSPLSRSFALMVILASSILTTVITSIQIWFDYRSNVASTQHVHEQVGLSYSASLASSLWTFDDVLVRSQLDGIANLKEIEAAEITSKDGTQWTAGERKSIYKLQQEIPLIYENGGYEQELGRLLITSSLDSIYWALAEKFAIVLVLNFVKTTCMSLVILYLFYCLIGRHLIDLVTHLANLDLMKSVAPFQLDRGARRKENDELDKLADVINVMHAGIQSSYRDIADYRDKLELALQKERELSGLQRQFVSMVSHEFRTPLAIIDGNAQRLLRKKTPVPQDRLNSALEKVRLTVRRLTELMESVLSAARLEDGRIEFESDECQIVDLLSEIASAYQELDSTHEIVPDFSQLPQTIDADDKLLRQVFSNLISNAMKYSPAGTSIWIKGWVEEPRNIVISIRDEGVGIPKEEQNKLFERFFRASTSTGIAGTGIGLHLVKHLIDMHKGTILIQSEIGKGTEFIVTLPIVQHATQTSAVDNKQLEKPDQTGVALSCA